MTNTFQINLLKSFLSIGVLFTFGCSNNTTDKEMDKGPVAIKVPKELTMHGDTRIDNYYWLNDRENEEVIAYLNAENDYTKDKLKHTEDFQASLFEEIKGRIKEDDESVPYKSNGYYYYTRFEKGKEYPIYCRKKETLAGKEEVMLDANVLAEGHAYHQIGGLSISPDNKMLAYGVDTVSRRIYTIHFKNLETGETLSETIPNTGGSATWANDNTTLFYAVKDETTLRTSKILKHKLGTSAGTDTEVFSEDDDTYVTFVYKSKSKDYIIIGSYSTLSTEYRFLDANTPDGDFLVFQPRERDLEYSIAHFGDYFYIRTNLDAKNFRLMRTSVNATYKENWEEVIAHRKDVLLEGIEIFKDYLVVDERTDGLTQLRIIRWDDKSEHYLDFGEDTYSAYTSTNPDFDTEILRYGYTSLTTPNSTIDYNMSTRSKKVMKEQEVVGGYNKDDYQSERLWATAKDGTKIPMSVVYKKGIKKDGSNNLLLYGYGSYGNTIDPYFSTVRLSLLDRGFVYVIAHIRGGEYLGRPWYEDGKLLKKKNTFTDFIDCADFLVEEGYTSPDNLYAMGGSAGGLLMGAIINLRPELFNGVVAAVPFVDVVTTMLDESIPLTTGEYDEWGNPNNKEYYEYIKSYSPYDNVEEKEYPNMLVTTGLHDSQVQYWEPAKWVAKLRDKKTGDNTLLLHTNMDAGHGGASGRFERFKEVAMEYAFIFDLAGIKE